MRAKIRKILCISLSILCCISIFTGCNVEEQIDLVEEEILKAKEEVGYPEMESSQTVIESTEFLTQNSEIDKQEAEAIATETEHSAYTDNYAYGTLNEEAKLVYDEVLNTILEQSEKTEISTTDIDVLEQAYKAVCSDYGGLFWVSGYVYTQYTRAGKPVGMDFTPQYTMSYEERMELQQQIDASVEELLAGISISDSDYAKAKYVFEILIQNVDYESSIENNQNIISVFLNRATVCQGYACATQYLLRLLGIQSAIVTGNANGEAHAWNLVRLDGEYYYMDTTWGNSRYFDDGSQMAKYVNYSYLAVTSEEISRTHILDNSFALPECTSMTDNYFVQEGRYFTEFNPDAIGAILADVWNAGGMDVAIKFSSPDLYNQAMNYFITEQHIADYCENITSIYYLEDMEQYVLTFNLRE